MKIKACDRIILKRIENGLNFIQIKQIFVYLLQFINITNFNGIFMCVCSFYSENRTMPVKISFNIDLGPDLSNEVMDVARKQGEDPERLSSDIQELRDMIFGKCIVSTGIV